MIALASLLGCTSSGVGSKDVSAAGTLLSSIADIELVSDTLAVGIVRGEEGVRRLEWSETGASATLLKSPSGCTSPVNLAAGDTDGDGLTDVLVFDSACRNWVALGKPGGEFEPVAWGDVLPELTPNHYLYYEDWNADGEPELVGANAFRLEGFSRSASEWRAFSAEFRGVSFSNSGISDDLVVHGAVDDERLVLFSRGGDFSSLPVETLSGEMTARSELSQVNLELLKPYEAYDQLRSVPVHGCGGFALAAGLFPSSPRFPRRLVRLDVLDQGSYSARTIATARDNVVSVATGRRGGTPLAGVVSRQDGHYAFELLTVRDCEWVRIAGPHDLLFHPLCSEVPDGRQICSGERLVAANHENGLTFLHFAGTWLDVIKASEHESDWELVSNAWPL